MGELYEYTAKESKLLSSETPQEFFFSKFGGKCGVAQKPYCFYLVKPVNGISLNRKS